MDERFLEQLAIVFPKFAAMLGDGSHHHVEQVLPPTRMETPGKSAVLVVGSGKTALQIPELRSRNGRDCSALRLLNILGD
jgi:hypothetical protein